MLLLVILACAGLLLAHAPLWAQEDGAQDNGSIGLVIVKGDGAVQTYCVAIPDGAQENFTGYDVLMASGVRQKNEVSAMGAAVCSLDGEGCDYPRESCFCQCEGGPCAYWSYWTQDDAGAWVYSNRGPSSGSVQAGRMQGWVWGDGSADKSPPPLDYADVCTADGETVVYASVVSVTGGAVPPAPDVPVAGEVATVTIVTTETPIAEINAAVVTEPAEDVAALDTSNPSALIALGLLLVPLVILLAALLFMLKPKAPTL